MISMPTILRPAIDRVRSEPMERIFTKAAIAVLRDLAVTLEIHDTTIKPIVVQTEAGRKISLEFPTVILTAEMIETNRNINGITSETRFAIQIRDYFTTYLYAEQMATVQGQVHRINKARSGLGLPNWTISQLLAGGLSSTRLAA